MSFTQTQKELMTQNAVSKHCRERKAALHQDIVQLAIDAKAANDAGGLSQAAIFLRNIDMLRATIQDYAEWLVELDGVEVGQ